MPGSKAGRAALVLERERANDGQKPVGYQSMSSLSEVLGPESAEGMLITGEGKTIYQAVLRKQQNAEYPQKSVCDSGRGGSDKQAITGTTEDRRTSSALPEVRVPMHSEEPALREMKKAANTY